MPFYWFLFCAGCGGVYCTAERREPAIQEYCTSIYSPEQLERKRHGIFRYQPGFLSKALKEEYPNLIKNYYRYNPVANVVSAGDRYFKENIAIGDTAFVSMYGLPVLYGDPGKAFENVNAAVVTASFAKKMFGTENAIGKRIAVQTVVEHVKQD